MVTLPLEWAELFVGTYECCLVRILVCGCVYFMSLGILRTLWSLALKQHCCCIIAIFIFIFYKILFILKRESVCESAHA